jgi:hypothetical protein
MSIQQNSRHEHSTQQAEPVWRLSGTLVISALGVLGVVMLASLGIVAGLYLQASDAPRADNQDYPAGAPASVGAPAEDKLAAVPLQVGVVRESANTERPTAALPSELKQEVDLVPPEGAAVVPNLPGLERNPPAAAAPAGMPIQDLSRLSATELREQLAKVPEIDFYADVDKLRTQLIDAYLGAGSGKNLADAAAKQKLFETSSPPAFREKVNDLLLKKAKSEGLPLRTGNACRVDLDTAKTMGHLSTTLRRRGFVSNPVKGTPGRTAELKSWCEETKVENYPGGASTLLQMLQVEDEPCRLLLVQELAKLTKNSAASAALARMAMFDLSAEVRQACVAVLKRRPMETYRQEFLKGLRYTWPPAAAHAAEALVALGDKQAVPSLINLLDKPDPTLPVLHEKTKTHMVNELVRINHMRNCYLCHASSQAPSPLEVSTTGKTPASLKTLITYEEPCRGLVPRAGRALPVAYYADRKGGDFVRADITYLHQDFSVPQSVVNANPWPETQRYDYLVRSRKATPEEVAALALQPAESNYPQRNAVLYALHNLTGQELGTATEAWQKYLDDASGQRGK